MSRFSIHAKISYKDCIDGIAYNLPKLKEWFVANPKRKVCHVDFVYGKVIKVRKKHIEADLFNAAEKLRLAGKFRIESEK